MSSQPSTGPVPRASMCVPCHLDRRSPICVCGAVDALATTPLPAGGLLGMVRHLVPARSRRVGHGHDRGHRVDPAPGRIRSPRAGGAAPAPATRPPSAAVGAGGDGGAAQVGDDSPRNTGASA